MSPKKKITPEDINLRHLPHAPEQVESETESTAPEKAEINPAVVALTKEADNRAIALSERLQNADSSDDGAIREELAAIAASMVAVTAASEGSGSPIHKILSGKSGSDRRESLAARSKKTLTTAQDATK